MILHDNPMIIGDTHINQWYNLYIIYIYLHRYLLLVINCYSMWCSWDYFQWLVMVAGPFSQQPWMPAKRLRVLTSNKKHHIPIKVTSQILETSDTKENSNQHVDLSRFLSAERWIAEQNWWGLAQRFQYSHWKHRRKHQKGDIRTVFSEWFETRNQNEADIS